jgi:hypothetical protein
VIAGRKHARKPRTNGSPSITIENYRMLVNNPGPESIDRIESEPSQLRSEHPTSQQLLAYRCQILSQLADALAPAQRSTATRKALHLFADELFEISLEINKAEPEGYKLEELLAELER